MGRQCGGVALCLTLVLLVAVLCAAEENSIASFPVAGAGQCQWPSPPCSTVFSKQYADYPTIWDGSLSFQDSTPENFFVTNVTLTLYGSFPADAQYDGVDIPVSINGEQVNVWTYDSTAFTDSCTAEVDTSPALTSDGGPAYILRANNTVTYDLSQGPDLSICGLVIDVFYAATPTPTPSASPSRSLSRSVTASRSVNAPSESATPSVSASLTPKPSFTPSATATPSPSVSGGIQPWGYLLIGLAIAAVVLAAIAIVLVWMWVKRPTAYENIN